MKGLILVVLTIVLGGVSTSKIHNYHEHFNQAKDESIKFFDRFQMIEYPCLLKTTEDFNVTIEELENSQKGTRLYCCGYWNFIDCVLGVSKVYILMIKIKHSSFENC